MISKADLLTILWDMRMAAETRKTAERLDAWIARVELGEWSDHIERSAKTYHRAKVKKSSSTHDCKAGETRVV